MAKQKITKEEKQEAKKDKQIFNDLIRRLKAKGVFFEIIN